LENKNIVLEKEVIIDKLECELANVVSQLLSVDRNDIGRESSFFELGGDSISVIQLVSLSRNIELYFSATDVFRNPTIKALAKFRDRQAEAAIPQIQLRYCSQLKLVKRPWPLF
jgi:acyl carrier protein